MKKYTNLNVRPEQLKQFKLEAAKRGVMIIELFDKVLEMLDQQVDRPTDDPLNLRGGTQSSKRGSE